VAKQFDMIDQIRLLAGLCFVVFFPCLTLIRECDRAHESLRSGNHEKIFRCCSLVCVFAHHRVELPSFLKGIAHDTCPHVHVVFESDQGWNLTISSALDQHAFLGDQARVDSRLIHHELMHANNDKDSALCCDVC
jgi:hypothetical protein